MVFLNEMLPVDNYHYRICQDSIGSSIENLHRHMILKSNIAELDRLHMQDQLTGLQNRFALKRRRGEYVSSAEGYSTAPDNIRSLGFGAGMGLPNIKKYTDDMRIETEIGKGTDLYLTVKVRDQ